jgi:hypothetical protein
MWEGIHYISAKPGKVLLQNMLQADDRIKLLQWLSVIKYAQNHKTNIKFKFQQLNLKLRNFKA